MSLGLLSVAVLSGSAILAGCGTATMSEQEGSSAGASTPQQVVGGQEVFGPYEVVENWPKPLPDGDDGVTHAGWTWGSRGSVYAETPDRIWVAMRGELPLPEGNPPWTPYALLQPSRGNATGNDDGFEVPRAGNVEGVVIDANGQQVASINLGQLEAGTHTFAPGSLPNMPTLADGTYTVLLTQTVGDQLVPLATTVAGRVTGVDFNSDPPVLLIGETRLALEDVRVIREPHGS
jgi:hypothetical protein